MPAGVEPCFNGHGTMQIDRLQQFLHLQCKWRMVHVCGLFYQLQALLEVGCY